jgi:hypothetical protein
MLLPFTPGHTRRKIQESLVFQITQPIFHLITVLPPIPATISLYPLYPPLHLMLFWCIVTMTIY